MGFSKSFNDGAIGTLTLLFAGLLFVAGCALGTLLLKWSITMLPDAAYMAVAILGFCIIGGLFSSFGDWLSSKERRRKMEERVNIRSQSAPNEPGFARRRNNGEEAEGESEAVARYGTPHP